MQGLTSKNALSEATGHSDCNQELRNLTRRLRSRSLAWRWCRGPAKVNLRSRARSFIGLEVSVIRLEPAPSREQAIRESLDVSVVVLKGVVIPLAFDRNPILGPRKFVLQAQEVFVRLQLRIVF